MLVHKIWGILVNIYINIFCCCESSNLHLNTSLQKIKDLYYFFNVNMIKLFKYVVVANYFKYTIATYIRFKIIFLFLVDHFNDLLIIKNNNYPACFLLFFLYPNWSLFELTTVHLNCLYQKRPINLSGSETKWIKRLRFFSFSTQFVKITAQAENLRIHSSNNPFG